MDTRKTFANYIFGEIPFYPEWLMLLAMFLLGGFIFQRWKAQKGAENKSGKFQWQYFLKDPQNYIDLIGNIPLGWFVLRFFSLEGDMEYLMIYSVFLGTLGNTIVDLGFDLARGKNPLRKYESAFDKIKSIFKSK